MSSKCKVTSTGSKGCHGILANVMGLILDLCDNDVPEFTAVRDHGDPPVRQVKPINKVFGIPLHSICEAFSTVVTEQAVSDPETID